MKYGCIIDRDDERDFKFSQHPKAAAPITLPDVWDMRPHLPLVYDQGQLGSCTGNATAGCVHAINPIVFGLDDPPSRLFPYYWGRAAEGTINEDSGAMIRDVVKGVAQYGIPSESTWPYNVKRFAETPTQAAIDEAGKAKAISYHRVSCEYLDELRTCLYRMGPVIFGMTLFESFESSWTAKSGRVTVPKDGEREVGGHAMLLVGYDHPGKQFIVRNSWGKDWGLSGYCLIPYDLFLQWANDAWCIDMMSDPVVPSVHG